MVVQRRHELEGSSTTAARRILASDSARLQKGLRAAGAERQVLSGRKSSWPLVNSGFQWEFPGCR